ncbi:MAG: iron-sulfur cluster assembly scaffold protein [Verrucomicrobiales bacterium]|nr:iron-sulfur cluster assembly scaffold protein [Verrucomicrobiales bacterium]
MSDFEDKLQNAIANPQNQGEMSDADSVGTVGNPECGDMVRMWLKFEEKDGKKVIDKASFQSFGCQTAIAVASMATEMLKGKTVEEAQALSSTDLSAPLGPLPPMKIHCGEMVEGALRDALNADKGTEPAPATGSSNTLLGDMNRPKIKSGKLKVVLEK